MENRILADKRLPVELDEAAWGVIRRFYWYPSIHVDDNDIVTLRTGEALCATFDTIAELRTFVSGMATALVVLPPEAVNALEEALGVEPDWDDRPGWWPNTLP